MSAPVDAAPVDAAPVDAAPVDAAPVDAARIRWHALPAGSIWAPPLADTRSPLTTLTVRSGEPLAIDASVAAGFPLVSASGAGWEARIGLAAALFLGFEADGPLIFDLETFDGWFALPIDVAAGPWTGRLEWSHVSAHFADGVRDNAVLPGNSDPWSRESARLLGARALGPARFDLSVGAILHSAPGASPLSFGVGGEVEGPWRVAPYAAVHVGLAAEDAWAPSLCGQAGLRLRIEDHRLRVAVAARTGPEDTGKRRPGDEQWVGLLFGFDIDGVARVQSRHAPPP